MFEIEEDKTMFMICSTNQDCSDCDRCTFDYCDVDTKLCESAQIKCTNCVMTSIDMFEAPGG